MRTIINITGTERMSTGFFKILEIFFPAAFEGAVSEQKDQGHPEDLNPPDGLIMKTKSFDERALLLRRLFFLLLPLPRLRLYLYLRQRRRRRGWFLTD